MTVIEGVAAADQVEEKTESGRAKPEVEGLVVEQQNRVEKDKEKITTPVNQQFTGVLSIAICAVLSICEPVHALGRREN